MELKQALAVSLIAVVAASLVLLIARALDVQTASRLEPQLAQIAEELQTVRKLLAQGRATAGSGGPTLAESPTSSASQPSGFLGSGGSPSLRNQGAQETLVVWYFHGTMRCPTCQAIEALAHEIVQMDFAQELASGRIVWRTGNYEKPFYSALAQKMQVRMPVVALARMQGDQLLQSKTLEEVWGLVQDKTKFRDFLVKEIRQMLGVRATEPVGSTHAGETASGKKESQAGKSSGSTGEPTLATRPNLLRQESPERPAEKSPAGTIPEAPSVDPY